MKVNKYFNYTIQNLRNLRNVYGAERSKVLYSNVVNIVNPTNAS